MLKQKLAALKSRKANEVLEREIAALKGLPVRDDNKATDNESIADQTQSEKKDNAGGQFG
jgi:hypothetical protein